MSGEVICIDSESDCEHVAELGISEDPIQLTYNSPDNARNALTRTLPGNVENPCRSIQERLRNLNGDERPRLYEHGEQISNIAMEVDFATDHIPDQQRSFNHVLNKENLWPDPNELNGGVGRDRREREISFHDEDEDVLLLKPLRLLSPHDLRCVSNTEFSRRLNGVERHSRRESGIFRDGSRVPNKENAVKTSKSNRNLASSNTRDVGNEGDLFTKTKVSKSLDSGRLHDSSHSEKPKRKCLKKAGQSNVLCAEEEGDAEKQVLRSHKSSERHTLKAIQRKEAIIACFEKFESTSCESHRKEMTVVVSTEYYESQRGKRVIRSLQSLYPEQVLLEKHPFVDNAILWRRQMLSADLTRSEFHLGKELDYAVLCFESKNFHRLVENREVEGLAKRTVSAMSGKRIEFLLEGSQRHGSATVTRKEQENATGIDMSAASMRECEMMLYMEYGITTKQVANEAELTEYLSHVTDSLANAPYVKPTSFLDINKKYRSLHVSGCSIGISLDGRGGGSEGRSGCDLDGTANPGEHVMRIEGSSDCGVIYLNWLSQIPGMSLDKAKTVRSAYPTLKSLFDAYDGCKSVDEREELLMHLKCSGRRLGLATSRLIALVFNSLDNSAVVRSSGEGIRLGGGDQ